MSRSTLSLLLLSLSARFVSAQCDLSPDRDVDVHFIWDVASAYQNVCGKIGRRGYSAAITTIGEWVEAAGFEFSGSVAGASRVVSADCYRQSVINVDYAQAASRVSALIPRDYSTDMDSTYFAGVNWVRQALWHDHAGDGVRRLFFIATHGNPRPEFELTSWVKLPVSTLESSLADECKLQGNPPSAQIAHDIRGAGAGVLFHNWYSLTNETAFPGEWESWFETHAISDFVVLPYYREATQVQKAVQNGLYQLLCPTWLASTSTLPPINAEVMMQCLEETKACQLTDENWQHDLRFCYDLKSSELSA